MWGRGLYIYLSVNYVFWGAWVVGMVGGGDGVFFLFWVGLGGMVWFGCGYTLLSFGTGVLYHFCFTSGGG